MKVLHFSFKRKSEPKSVQNWLHWAPFRTDPLPTKSYRKIPNTRESLTVIYLENHSQVKEKFCLIHKFARSYQSFFLSLNCCKKITFLHYLSSDSSCFYPNPFQFRLMFVIVISVAACVDAWHMYGVCIMSLVFPKLTRKHMKMRNWNEVFQFARILYMRILLPIPQSHPAINNRTEILSILIVMIYRNCRSKPLEHVCWFP